MVSLFKNKLTIDQAADSLYSLMRQDDKNKWLSQLPPTAGLSKDVTWDELIFLDFFAIYFSLKFNRSSGWSDKDKCHLVFQKIFTLLISFWTEKNIGTTDAVFNHIDGRLSVYSACIEESSEDPSDLMHSIGTAYAALALSANSTDPQIRSQIWFQLKGDRNNAVIKVGSDAFNNRIEMLYSFFDSSKLV